MLGAACAGITMPNAHTVASKIELIIFFLIVFSHHWVYKRTEMLLCSGLQCGISLEMQNHFFVVLKITKGSTTMRNCGLIENIDGSKDFESAYF